MRKRNTSTDRRIQRSRARLRQALIDLSLSRGYNDITIRDITQEAGVGYATFFRHYESKDDLLADAFEQSMEALNALLQPLGGADPVEEGRLIFEHIDDDHQLYEVLLRGQGVQPLLKQVEASAVREVMVRFSRAAGDGNGEDVEGAIPTAVIANHVVASIIALIKWWLRNDRPYSPEEMGIIYAALIMQPVQRLLDGMEVPGM